MSASKLLKPSEIDFAMEVRRAAGAAFKVIGEEFGLTGNQARDRLWKLEKYNEARKLLDADPLCLEGLGDLGVVDSGVIFFLRWYGADRLTDLCDWSEAELLELDACSARIGPKRLAQIKAVIGGTWAFAHPDRAVPIKRLRDFERAFRETAAPAPVPLLTIGNVIYLRGAEPMQGGAS